MKSILILLLAISTLVLNSCGSADQTAIRVGDTKPNQPTATDLATDRVFRIPGFGRSSLVTNLLSLPGDTTIAVIQAVDRDPAVGLRSVLVEFDSQGVPARQEILPIGLTVIDILQIDTGTFKVFALKHGRVQPGAPAIAELNLLTVKRIGASLSVTEQSTFLDPDQDHATIYSTSGAPTSSPPYVTGKTAFVDYSFFAPSIVASENQAGGFLVSAAGHFGYKLFSSNNLGKLTSGVELNTQNSWNTTTKSRRASSIASHSQGLISVRPFQLEELVVHNKHFQKSLVAPLGFSKGLLVSLYDQQNTLVSQSLIPKENISRVVNVLVADQVTLVLVEMKIGSRFGYELVALNSQFGIKWQTEVPKILWIAPKAVTLMSDRLVVAGNCTNTSDGICLFGFQISTGQIVQKKSLASKTPSRIMSLATNSKAQLLLSGWLGPDDPIRGQTKAFIGRVDSLPSTDPNPLAEIPQKGK
jgi:hypothetical protein